MENKMKIKLDPKVAIPIFLGGAVLIIAAIICLVCYMLRDSITDVTDKNLKLNYDTADTNKDLDITAEYNTDKYQLYYYVAKDEEEVATEEATDTAEATTEENTETTENTTTEVADEEVADNDYLYYDNYTLYEGNITLDKNAKIYFIYKLNDEYSQTPYMVEITNIDKELPKITKVNFKATNNSIEVNTEATDNKTAQLKYYYNVNSSEELKEAENNSYTFGDLTASTPYKTYVKVADNAGNEATTDLDINTTEEGTTSEGTATVETSTEGKGTVTTKQTKATAADGTVTEETVDNQGNTTVIQTKTDGTSTTTETKADGTTTTTTKDTAGNTTTTTKDTAGNTTTTTKDSSGNTTSTKTTSSNTGGKNTSGSSSSGSSSSGSSSSSSGSSSSVNNGVVASFNLVRNTSKEATAVARAKANNTSEGGIATIRAASSDAEASKIKANAGNRGSFNERNLSIIGCGIYDGTVLIAVYDFYSTTSAGDPYLSDTMMYVWDY